MALLSSWICSRNRSQLNSLGVSLAFSGVSEVSWGNSEGCSVVVCGPKMLPFELLVAGFLAGILRLRLFYGVLRAVGVEVGCDGARL